MHHRNRLAILLTATMLLLAGCNTFTGQPPAKTETVADGPPTDQIRFPSGASDAGINGTQLAATYATALTKTTGYTATQSYTYVQNGTTYTGTSTFKHALSDGQTATYRYSADLSNGFKAEIFGNQSGTYIRQQAAGSDSWSTATQPAIETPVWGETDGLPPQLAAALVGNETYHGTTTVDGVRVHKYTISSVTVSSRTYSGTVFVDERGVVRKAVLDYQVLTADSDVSEGTITYRVTDINSTSVSNPAWV